MLENTLAELAAAAAPLFPWLPVRFMLRTRLDSAAKIARYHGPLLQSHGDADRVRSGKESRNPERTKFRKKGGPPTCPTWCPAETTGPNYAVLRVFVIS